MATPAQKWARKRNFLKARLMGAACLFSVRLNEKCLTLKEKNKFDFITKKIDQILCDWDNNNLTSKKNYLNGENK